MARRAPKASRSKGFPGQIVLNLPRGNRDGAGQAAFEARVRPAGGSLAARFASSAFRYSSQQPGEQKLKRWNMMKSVAQLSVSLPHTSQ
jgi:hypothetical protein